MRPAPGSAGGRACRLVLAALLIAPWITPLPGHAQTGSPTQRPPVQRGQEYYEQSRFDEAISLLRDLVDRGSLVGEDLQKAREILARSYVKKGYPVQAREMFRAILRTNPTWKPDPIRVPPDETAVFEQALKDVQAEGAPPTETPPAPRDTVRAAPVPTPPAPTPPKPQPQVPPATRTEEGGKKGIPWWVWAGGVVLVGGVAAAAAGGGGGGGSSPPPPPVLANFPPPP